MRLTELRVDSLPGLEHGLHLEGLSPGVNVVLGPNASGKSSLIRALLAILYPGEPGGGLVDARVELITADGSRLTARRLGESVSWQREGEVVRPPALPPAHLVGTYVLRLEDLLGPADGERSGRRAARRSSAAELLDEHIARRLDSELSGGIDLKAVRHGLGSQAEKGQKLAARLRDAGTSHNELRRARAELHRQELRLAAAREELAASAAEAVRAPLTEDASSLLEATLAVRASEAELAALPPQLGALLGNEADEYAETARLADEHRRDLRELAELASAADRTLTVEGEALPTVADAELQLDRAERLVALSEQRTQRERELAALTARHGEALRRLGGRPQAVAALSRPPGADGADHSPPEAFQSRTTATPELAVDLGNEALERLERLLDKRQAARAELHEVRRQLEEMSRLVEPDDEDDDALLDVRAGIYRGGRTLDGLSSPLGLIRGDLVRWLREPLPAQGRPTWAWLIALAVMLATGVGAVLELPTTWLAVLAGTGTIWILVMWLLMKPRPSALKERIEADVMRLQEVTGIPLPAEWSHASVVDVILDVDDEIGRRRSAERNAAQYDRDLMRLTDGSHRAQRQLRAIEAELEALAAEVGYSPDPDLGLTLWLQAAREVESLDGALAGVRAELHGVQQEYDELLEHLLPFLEPAAQADDPLSVRAQCRELLNRARRRDAALRERERLARERQRVEAELERRQAQLAELTERAELSNEAREAPAKAQRELAELVAQLPALRAAGERLLLQRSTCQQLRERLAHDPELLAAALAHDQATIENVRLAAAAAAERQQELARSIHRTERDIENASSERRLQGAAAERRLAADELAQHRHEALELAAAGFLLDLVEDEHQASGRPAALERAGAWFAKFTGGDYELTFEPTGTGGRRLGARAVAAGQRLALSELSSGTRAQLLLASRLAFAIETEADGETLPFLLDEALSTSDEQRFGQVAAAVLRAAAEDGRQFIYLSARTDDAELWQDAAARHGGASLVHTISQVASG